MAAPRFVAFGHITQDWLPGGSFAPGGTVSFAATTARNLGLSAGIVTVAPAFLRSLPLFHEIKIAGRVSEVATIFENIYNPQGREQFVRAVAPPVERQDVPLGWTGEAGEPQIVHIGPVAQECSPQLLDLFPSALVGITPQGFMRRWDAQTGRVSPCLWEGAQAAPFLARADALVLSEEDLPKGGAGHHLLESYIAACPVVVLTQGARGCTVYAKGQVALVPGFPALEIDPTGAGDVFAAAFFIQLYATQSPIKAAQFANAAAACNIEAPGLAGVPTLDQVLARLGQNRGYV